MKKLQNANEKKLQKKKIKKALKPKDFFNFSLDNGNIPLDNGKIPSKKYGKKLKNFFGGKVGKTEPQV